MVSLEVRIGRIYLYVDFDGAEGDAIGETQRWTGVPALRDLKQIAVSTLR